MKQTVTESMFIGSFTGGCSNNFSYEGKKALFAYLEECEYDGNEIELDPIAFCCEYCEYATAEEAYLEYTMEDRTPVSLMDDVEAECTEWLRGCTTVIAHESGIIIACF